MKSDRKRRWTRRQMLRRVAAAAAAPYVITSAALGGQGRPPASERIVMGAVGVGGRGGYDLGAFMWNDDVQMVAVCDVKGDRRRAGKDRVDRKYGNSDCAAYIDLRELLAREDIDATLIATGDNWHSEGILLAVRRARTSTARSP